MDNKDTNKSIFYMSWILDKDILEKSSSGGVFTALSQYVFNKNGIVFGVYQDPKTLVLKQVPVMSIGELDALRRSKYYQSEAFESYQKVKEYLLMDKWVLFSGTMCQIAALLAFLGKTNRKKLITVDVLCHGVSSAKIFKLYADNEMKKSSKKIIKFSFRTKEIGWNCGSMTHFYADGTKKVILNNEDCYFRAFNENLILRESCYKCKFTNTNRISDFTLADFWGVNRIEKLVSDEQLSKGVGLVLVNNKRSLVIWNELQNFVFSKQIEPCLAIPYNSSLSHPPIPHKKYKLFYKKLKKYETKFDKLIKRLLWKEYLKQSIRKTVGEKNIKWIKKIISH